MLKKGLVKKNTMKKFQLIKLSDNIIKYNIV